MSQQAAVIFAGQVTGVRRNDGVTGTIGVVEIDEIEMTHLAIHCESDQQQSETDPARTKTQTRCRR